MLSADTEFPRLPAVAAEVELALAGAAVVVAFEDVVAAAADPQSDELVCHAAADPGADCGGVAGDGGGDCAAVVVESSKAANGWASVSCAIGEACGHWDDPMERDALTSDAELGTA